MRIIAGKYRNRKIVAPPGKEVRPTPERVREALFSILGGDLSGVVFYDLYAGAGSVGLDALSRGARRVVFVEKDKRALQSLHANIRHLGCGDRVVVYETAVENLWPDKYEGADAVFLDPPYGTRPQLPFLGDYLERSSSRPLVIYQHGKVPIDTGWMPERLRHRADRRYGSTILSFYREVEPGDETLEEP